MGTSILSQYVGPPEIFGETQRVPKGDLYSSIQNERLPAEKSYVPNSEQTRNIQNAKVRDRKPKPTVIPLLWSWLIVHHFWFLLLFFVVVIIVMVDTTKLEDMFSTLN